jgi:hypothetical protein
MIVYIQIAVYSRINKFGTCRDTKDNFKLISIKLRTN